MFTSQLPTAHLSRDLADAHEALAGLHDVDPQTWLRERSLDERDRALCCLITLVQADVRGAAEGILHLLSPIAESITLRALAPHRRHMLAELRLGMDDVPAHVQGSLWEVISTFPVDRKPARIGSNIYWQTWTLSFHDHSSRIEFVPLEVSGWGHEIQMERARRYGGQGHAPLTESSDAAIDSTCTLEDLLQWAELRNIIDAKARYVLATVYHRAAPPRTADLLAKELGISAAGVRKICSRAREQLAQAVLNELHGHTGDLTTSSAA